MFLRQAPTMTLSDLQDSLDQRVETISISPGDIVVDSVVGSIRVKEREVPITEGSIEALANHAQIPNAFHKRLPNDLRDNLFNELLRRDHIATLARLTDTSIISLREPSARIIEPRRLVEVAANVLSPNALVVDFTNSPDFLGFDAIVPEGFERGIGGDARVGDITRGGLRFGQNLKQNLAPWVQRYMYRLICTNGMEMMDAALKVDARGNSVDEVLAELEIAAELAFSKVESDMAHFYDLRNEVLDSPERTMARISAEHGISDRVRLGLIESVPSIISDNGQVTMFDLVNLVTNAPNDPQSRVPRRTLEQFGGGVVTDHANRCRTCQSKLH
jgi:hypothetical protein